SPAAKGAPEVGCAFCFWRAEFGVRRSPPLFFLWSEKRKKPKRRRPPHSKAPTARRVPRRLVFWHRGSKGRIELGRLTFNAVRPGLVRKRDLWLPISHGRHRLG